MEEINMKRLPVPSLTMLCQEKFKELTVDTLTNVIDYRDTSIPEAVVWDIRDYMARIGTTGHINEDFLNLILMDEEYPPLLRLYSLKIFLINNCQHLETGSFLPPYDREVFKTILENGSGLTVLNLNGVWTYDHNLYFVVNLLEKCEKLKKLYIPSIGTDEILIAISQHSKKLSVLNISGRTDITEIGIDALTTGCNTENLTIVDIGIPGEKDICYTDVALILERCPNIRSLGSYSYVGVSLAYILQNISNTFTCNLEYLRDSETNDDILKAIIYCCPKLTSLYLHDPNISCFQYLEGLSLEEFTIYSSKYEDLLSYLSIIGFKLKALNIASIDTRVNLGQIIDLCPELLNFFCTDIEYIDFPGTDKTCKLEILKLISVQYSKEQLIDFLCNMPTLKSLDIDEVDLNNEDILCMFCHHSFDNLENVFFRRAPDLGVFAIEIIAEHCPKLNRIGRTSGWNIEYQELAYLECLLRSGNANVKVLL